MKLSSSFEGTKILTTLIVYTMWQYPTMLPLLYTWGPVVRKLMDGAGMIY